MSILHFAFPIYLPIWLHRRLLVVYFCIERQQSQRTIYHVIDGTLTLIGGDGNDTDDDALRLPKNVSEKHFLEYAISSDRSSGDGYKLTNFTVPCFDDNNGCFQMGVSLVLYDVGNAEDAEEASMGWLPLAGISASTVGIHIRESRQSRHTYSSIPFAVIVLLDEGNRADIVNVREGFERTIKRCNYEKDRVEQSIRSNNFCQKLGSSRAVGGRGRDDVNRWISRRAAEELQPALLALMVASVLLEKRIFLVSEDKDLLISAIILMTEFLIKPLGWFHVLIPVATGEIVENLVHCPAPFLIGVETKNAGEILKQGAGNDANDCNILVFCLDYNSLLQNDKIW